MQNIPISKPKKHSSERIRYQIASIRERKKLLHQAKPIALTKDTEPNSTEVDGNHTKQSELKRPAVTPAPSPPPTTTPP